MATDVFPAHAISPELAQAVANLQRAVDEMQQLQSLQTEVMLKVIRGQWDAAQFGMQSAEAILVALNPSLQGKVHAIPFDPDR